MFRNEYQGGPFVEIFSAQGKNPGAKWKIYGSPSAIWKEFDKEVKGFVFVLEGSSQTNKIQLPKETRQTLGLTQQFLVLQIYVPLGQDFSTELLEQYSPLGIVKLTKVTDLGNIKRRLYLSTVHKELSVTPLHAKLPLFMIKRKIWCNLCIDLVAFTSEIFKGAVFQSLDGIIISANCKLRKIFTLKSKPQDTAEEDDIFGLPFTADDPTDTIPRTCQLNTDVPQVTQLLNMTKLRQPEIRFGGRPLTSSESDQLINRGQGSTHTSKNQDVSHIAFGSKVLGPPPPSGRRFNTRVSGEITKSLGSRSSRSGQQLTLEKGNESIQDTKRSGLSPSPFCKAFDQGDKENIHQTNQFTNQNDDWVFPENCGDSFQIESNGQSVAIHNTSCSNLSLPLNTDVESESKQTGEHQKSHKEIFTFSSRPRSAPHGKSPNMSPEGCMSPLELNENIDGVCRGAPMEDDFFGSDSNEEDDPSEFIQGASNLKTSHSTSGSADSTIFKAIPLKMMSGSPEYWKHKGYSKHSHLKTLSSAPQDSVVKKVEPDNIPRSLMPTPCLSPTGSKPEFSKESPSTFEKKKDTSVSQLRASISKKSLKEILRENSSLKVETPEYDWRNYQPSRLSASELQMLASMKRQQNEELEDNGISHGLSASQIDNCNVSISTSSDDTTTWNSCLPPPVNQGHHYQKEMNPLSHSNPRDWLNVFSPPIILPSQELAKHIEASASLNIPGEDDFSAEEDEEVLTLLYDPCLNCYFDPETGKYYELA
ncbi:protein CFAP20DC isoform X3 [Dermochelys coriacea]|uniref:protein CFAP20DC isoform X3 n=1 Tax=Dermochelys coriacea TaxID=27794 RepID=UPI001CAA1C06|nr:protein CFAP20DC isoform X3 [Dermochelys coriacea]